MATNQTKFLLRRGLNVDGMVERVGGGWRVETSSEMYQSDDDSKTCVRRRNMDG